MNKNSNWIVGALVLIAIWLIAWSAIGYHFLKKDIALYESVPGGSAGYTVRFGIVTSDANGNDVLSEETSTIPLRYKDSGFRYGLEITAPGNISFAYRCVFHFSAAPKVLTGAAFETTEPSTTVRTPLISAQGQAVEEYWFDPGDPSGDQSVDIYVNGKLIKTINYTVVPEK